MSPLFHQIGNFKTEVDCLTREVERLARTVSSPPQRRDPLAGLSTTRYLRGARDSVLQPAGPAPSRRLGCSQERSDSSLRNPGVLCARAVNQNLTHFRPLSRVNTPSHPVSGFPQGLQN